MNKTNLKAILILFPGLLLTLVGLEWVIRKGLQFNLNVKTEYIVTHKIPAKVLLHGPCEPEWMLDPERIAKITGQSVYNLSLNHSDFADNFLHLHLLIKYQKKLNQSLPSVLVLYTTPVSFDSLLANTFNTYRFASYLEDEMVKETVKEMDPDYFKYRQVPMLKYAYYGDLVYFKALQGWFQKGKGQKLPQYPNGYVPATSSWNRTIVQYQENENYHRPIQWSKLREKYFRKTIALAQEHGISVILYESPIFAPDLEKQKDRYQWIERIKSIAAEYKVPFWCYADHPMANEAENFWSAYNTTLKGSNLFSDLLGEDLHKWLEASKGKK